MPHVLDTPEETFEAFAERAAFEPPPSLVNMRDVAQGQPIRNAEMVHWSNVRSKDPDKFWDRLSSLEEKWQVTIARKAKERGPVRGPVRGGSNEPVPVVEDLGTDLCLTYARARLKELRDAVSGG
jgi:hypothetical protein